MEVAPELDIEVDIEAAAKPDDLAEGLADETFVMVVELDIYV